MKKEYRTVRFEETTIARNKVSLFDITYTEISEFENKKNKEISEISELTNTEISDNSNNLMYSYNELLFERIYELEGSDKIEFVQHHISKVRNQFKWLIKFEDVLDIRLHTGNFLCDALRESNLSKLIDFIKLLKQSLIIQRQPEIITKPNILLSFEYHDWSRGTDSFNNFIHALKKQGFIATNTKTTVFKNAFSGRELTERIVWIAGIEKLYYFIKYIHDINPKVKPVGSDKWKIARSFFCDEKHQTFPLSLSKQHDPSNPTDIKMIKSCIDLLI